MDENIEYEEALNKLKKYNQVHLLDRYEYLIDEKKENIIKQIKNIDFEQIKELYNNREKKNR